MSAHAQISTLSVAAIGRFMPMYMAVDEQAIIRAIGPTLRHILGRPSPVGRSLFEVMEIRRPAGVQAMAALREVAGVQLSVALRGQSGAFLRGLAMPVSDGLMLINLCFGIGVVDAVRRYSLTAAHFAPTDLTIELLYLVEAKAAVMGEFHSLNARLHGEKLLAQEQALTDALTGLRNRRALEAQLHHLVAQQTPFGMMHLDLDYFKAVNDTLGHAAGDFVLGEVTDILRRSTRASDTIARLGGDEFVLVMPHMTDLGQLRKIGARLIADLSSPMQFDGQECRISGSIGIVASTSYPQPDLDQMAADADAALYAAKRAGRGRAVALSAKTPPRQPVQR